LFFTTTFFFSRFDHFFEPTLKFHLFLFYVFTLRLAVLFPLLSFTFRREGFIFQAFVSLLHIYPLNFNLPFSHFLFRRRISRSISNFRPSIQTNLCEWITRKWNLHGYVGLLEVTNFYSSPGTITRYSCFLKRLK
jgi:hypothetical protein